MNNIPSEVSFGFEQMSKHIDIGDVSVTAKKEGTGFCICKTASGIEITYETKKDFFRALTFVKSVNETGESVSQKATFSTLCYMVDVSRNAVLSMDGAKDLICKLSLMGYNSMMLYAEDTYEIPGVPYFGHMRGRYSVSQMKELDDYAYNLGIELIPCVQTLAHLSSALRWNCFDGIKDTGDILLADCEKTYEFIDKMLSTLSSCFRTKRIHIGMDEAHNLGLGKYLDKHGYQNRFSILSKHLARVKEICDKYSLEPMIWGDMYFRLYNHGSYYMSEGRLPKEVIDEVPSGVGIVYWDYYTTDPKILDCMFENHKLFNRKLIFAGGAWKWTGIAPFNRISNEWAKIHLDACLRHKCDDVIVTGWGDNGGEASQISVLPCLSLYAEKCYDNDISDECFAKRFEDTFEISLNDFMKLDLPNEIYGEPIDSHYNPSKFLLYNGVFNGIADKHIPENAGKIYGEYAKTLSELAGCNRYGYLFNSLSHLCKVLETKAEMSKNIYKAYNDGDRDTLKKYAEEIIPETVKNISEYLEVFRYQWYKENKTIGFDVQEMRLGALKETLNSAALRIKGYLNGDIKEIEELTQPSLPYKCTNYDTLEYKVKLSLNHWEQISTASKHY